MKSRHKQIRMLLLAGILWVGLPEDSDRNTNGTLKAWPKWVQQEKPSPTGRYSFTGWRLWKKGDPLLASGLLGAVWLRPCQTVTVDK